ncbi:MAG: UDP-N-acetylmuramate dehydrogenase [bacterium]|nr:UDP-N-acetylmuramate dehydrogenase [bacterium]
MNYSDLDNEIKDLIKGKIEINKPMKKYTSFKVGGKADIVAAVDQIDQLKKLIAYLKENNIPYFVIGNGTNLLIKDEGIRGVIIKLSGSFKKILITGQTIQAGAGVTLNKLLEMSIKYNLSGLEFTTGIPGSVGGSLLMNAGIKGCSIGGVVDWVKVLSPEMKEVILKAKEIKFYYRESNLSQYIILEAGFSLEKSSRKAILERIKLYQERRTSINFPNAGSIFKNPLGRFAGELIEKAGLKGYSIGDAQVFPGHANFIQNIGRAKAKDILLLIDKIKETVQAQFGVNLELEIKVVGDN